MPKKRFWQFQFQFFSHGLAFPIPSISRTILRPNVKKERMCDDMVRLGGLKTEGRKACLVVETMTIRCIHNLVGCRHYIARERCIPDDRQTDKSQKERRSQWKLHHLRWFSCYRCDNGTSIWMKRLTIRSHSTSRVVSVSRGWLVFHSMLRCMYYIYYNKIKRGL